MHMKVEAIYLQVSDSSVAAHKASRPQCDIRRDRFCGGMPSTVGAYFCNSCGSSHHRSVSLLALIIQDELIQDLWDAAMLIDCANAWHFQETHGFGCIGQA